MHTKPFSVLVSNISDRKNIVQCGAIIMESIFSQILKTDTP